MKAKAITAGVAIALSLATPATSTAFSTGTTSKANPACTSRLFRNVARQVLHPWYEKAHGRYRMRRLVGCAANERTRRQMKRIRENQEAGKVEAVERYRTMTPNVGCGGRWAVPAWIVCDQESGGDWWAINPACPAYGPYQFCGHDGEFPWPPTSMKAKMGIHKYAAYLWAGGSGCSHWNAC